MSPAPNPERSSGEFRRMTKSVPAAVVVDGSGWKRMPGPRTAGKLVSLTKSLPAAAVVDGSGWGGVTPTAVALEVMLTLTDDADPAEVNTAVVRLINSLSAFEKSLGGSGVSLSVGRSSAERGRVVLCLFPNDQTGAESRLSQLAGVMMTATGAFRGVTTVDTKIVQISDSARPNYDIAL